MEVFPHVEGSHSNMKIMQALQPIRVPHRQLYPLLKRQHIRLQTIFVQHHADPWPCFNGAPAMFAGPQAQHLREGQ